MVVDASAETQLDRLVTLRGMTESDARARMSAQATREERRAVADLVVDNDGTHEALVEQVDAVWDELVRRATAPR
ncbi:dephospho-CoA kinase [Streptomyces californicus]